MTTEIKLTGFDTLGKIFSELPEDIAKKVGIAALRLGAKPILEQAQNLVPEGRTGKLADSLAIANVKSTRPEVTVYARRKKGFGGWHAHLVELGTKPHDIKNAIIKGKFYPLIHHPGTAPKPFLRPAFLSKKEEALKVIFGSITGEIVKKFKKEMKS